MSDTFEFIKLKDSSWFERQKIAGRTVARCLSLAREMIQTQDNLSLKEIERACLDVMNKQDCTPTFLNYKNSFPGAICTSVNKQLVHGIPTDYQIQDGDVVKVDLGCTYKGAIGDAAITVIKGTPKSPKHIELSLTCQRALEKAIQAVAIGKQLGIIGYAIHHATKSTGFGLITNYGGHGLDENKPHAQPFVYNKSQPNVGVRIQPGMTLAIEPMLVLGSPETRVLNDGWTVVTPEIGVHFEHTIFVSEDQIHIMTMDDGL